MQRPRLSRPATWLLTAALAAAPLLADAAKKKQPARKPAAAEPAKADDKKTEAAKPADDKKVDEKKADAAKPADDKKADEKAPAAAADEKKADAAKPADEKKPEAKKVEEPAEKTIEKGEDFLVRLTLKPGVLKPRRVAEVFVELSRKRDEPDPIDGDRSPVVALEAALTVTAPAGTTDKKAKKPGPAKPVELLLHNAGAPGAYFAHFTPSSDGVYTLRIAGTERPEEDGGKARPFDMTFRIGVGTATSETEAGQGLGKARRTSGKRRVVGSSANKVDDRLQKLMAEVAERFLETEQSFASAPAKGPSPEVAAALRSLAEKLAEAKGMTPAQFSSASGDFDALADALVKKLQDAAAAAEKPKDAKAVATAKTAFQSTWSGCTQCHVKFRYGLSADVSGWPEFEKKPWAR